MRKLFALFCLSTYLLSTTVAGELLKLPVVFQHYQEHKQLYKYLTVLEFLDMHYMHGSPLDYDYDRDMQLPFKTCTHAVISISVEAPPLVGLLAAPRIKLIEKQPVLPYAAPDYSFNYHSSIWQPPKAC